MRSLETVILYVDGKKETIVSDAWMGIEPDTVFAVFYEAACLKK
jgi:hypothetical protein